MSLWRKSSVAEALVVPLEPKRPPRAVQPGEFRLSRPEDLERMRYQGLSVDDLGVIAAWKHECQGSMDDLVDQFYDHIKRHSGPRSILDRHTTVERQRPMLTRYLLSLFEGRIDDEYLSYRERVGQAHDRIDLDANWYVGMYELVKRHMLKVVNLAGALPEELARFEEALSRIIQVDIALVSKAMTDSRAGTIEALKRQQSETMKGLIRDLVQSAKDGKLDHRVDPSAYQGDVREFVTAVNEMLDALVAPISDTAKALDRVARRDLGARVLAEYKGDHNLIKQAFNMAVGNLDEALGQVADTVDQVGSGAEQVSGFSRSLSEDATQQAAALEEIHSSLSDMASQTQRNAADAGLATKLSNEVQDHAKRGDQQMGRMLESMQEINESARQISKIIKAIDEIAFQTNLLSLNAAVEAARAGAHGRGFAVVAEEVRSLAQRSAKAAAETGELISGSIERVERGSSIARETAEALQHIVEGVARMSTLAADISRASQDQAGGVQQITEALGQIDQVTQNTAATAEESASAADVLFSQVQQLRTLVDQFELGA
ncbi:MAG: methyl-accepting chemotaxis protein [Candidatus Delongbacteria bacterium]